MRRKRMAQSMSGSRLRNTCQLHRTLDCPLQLLFIEMVATRNTRPRISGFRTGRKNPEPISFIRRIWIFLIQSKKDNCTLGLPAARSAIQTSRTCSRCACKGRINDSGNIVTLSLSPIQNESQSRAGRIQHPLSVSARIPSSACQCHKASVPSIEASGH